MIITHIFNHHLQQYQVDYTSTMPDAVTSHAAICQLTVAQSIFDKDVVLQVVAKTASAKQVSLKLDPNGNSVQLQYAGESVQLTQRNSIVRALTGRVLHYALDQEPHYLQGGSAARASHSPANAMIAGSLVAWMSVADSIRSTNSTAAAAAAAAGDDDTDALLETLEAHLKTRAFLVPASQCTVADWDLAVALLNLTTTQEYPLQVQRWLRQSYASFCLAAAAVGMTVSNSKIPAGLPEQQAPSPVFFYGTEDVAAVLQPKHVGNKQPSKKQPVKGQDQPVGGEQPKQPQQKQQQQDKKADNKKQVKAGGANQAPDVVDYNISALDIRVGKITKVWEHPEADKLFCEEIDLGPDYGTRQIASGLRPFYKAADMEGKLVLVLCNLKKRSLVGFSSHGMVLCASNADHTAVEFVVPPTDSLLGERVMFDDLTGEPEPENKVAKKKVFEKVAPDLKTDATGNVVWKGAVAKTSAGVVQAQNSMAGAQVS
jgi:aminoacyl tRNA synthase complex-interacting multifunctional protein 1